jgi:hypothetical protein
MTQHAPGGGGPEDPPVPPTPDDAVVSEPIPPAEADQTATWEPAAPPTADRRTTWEPAPSPPTVREPSLPPALPPPDPATVHEPTLPPAPDPGLPPPDRPTVREPTLPPAPDPALPPPDPDTLREPLPPAPDPATPPPPAAEPPAGPEPAQPWDPPPPAIWDSPTIAAPTTEPDPNAPTVREQAILSTPDPPTLAEHPVPPTPEPPALETATRTPEEPAIDPATGDWPLDELLVETPAVPEPHRPRPLEPAPPRRPVYYVSLTVAVMLVLGLVAGLAILTANPPVTRVGGLPIALNIPDLPSPSQPTPPSTPTTSAPTAPTGVFAKPAAHPLSTSTAAMPASPCDLPTFAIDDDAQASFYEAAKTCADDAFGGLFAEAGFDTVTVEVRTVSGEPVDTPCGEIDPAAPAMQCAGTVYMTPAHLRDVEGNGRYPGRYFGVFLREYARALQEAAGFPDLYEAARAAGASDEDVTTRASQQATCLAGIAAGAMADLGSVDGNIYTEIGQRLTEVDAPPDAAAWLEKGTGSRQLSACNSWSEG